MIGEPLMMLLDWSARSPGMNIIEQVLPSVREEVWKVKPKRLDELFSECVNILELK